MISFFIFIFLLPFPTFFLQAKLRPKSVLSDRILSGTQTLRLKASLKEVGLTLELICLSINVSDTEISKLDKLI